MVDFVGVLSLLAFLLVRLVRQNLDAFPSARLVLACFGHREQLTYLVLREKGGEGRQKPGMKSQTKQAPADVTQHLLQLIKVDYIDTHLFHWDWQHNTTEGRNSREANEFNTQQMLKTLKAMCSTQLENKVFFFTLKE